MASIFPRLVRTFIVKRFRIYRDDQEWRNGREHAIFSHIWTCLFPTETPWSATEGPSSNKPRCIFRRWKQLNKSKLQPSVPSSIIGSFKDKLEIKNKHPLPFTETDFSEAKWTHLRRYGVLSPSNWLITRYTSEHLINKQSALAEFVLGSVLEAGTQQSQLLPSSEHANHGEKGALQLSTADCSLGTASLLGQENVASHIKPSFFALGGQ